MGLGKQHQYYGHPSLAILIRRYRTGAISQRADRQTHTQYLTYKFVQGGSKFNSSIKLGESSSLNQGNKIQGSLSEGIKQDGSEFGGDIQGDKSAKVSQGNEINGQEAEGSEIHSAESWSQAL